MRILRRRAYPNPQARWRPNLLLEEPEPTRARSAADGARYG
jgi:hypothetical protein